MTLFNKEVVRQTPLLNSPDPPLPTLMVAEFQTQGSMEDHIFGTFSTDHLKLTHERASALGLQHRVRTIPIDPLPHEPFVLIVTSGANFAPREVVLFYTTDGTPPTLESSQIPFAPIQRTWNTIAWGYVTEWRAEVRGMADGTVLRYRIAGREVGGEWQWAEWPHPQRVVEQTFMHGEAAALLTRPKAPSEFTRLIDRQTPPTWAQEAIIYQIFIDRFARDDDEPWGDIPLDQAHGGTIRGVTRHLDHIASLGITCIWLTPLFPSPTYHGYDATDYYEVEPRLGTKADLKELVERAHALGLRVILDFICNHVSNHHPLFLEAMADPQSEARNWFWFEEDGGLGYRAFFGVPTMPDLNTDYLPVRDYLLRAAEMWIQEIDVDGYRLDYAHGPSHAFWAEFWSTVKRAKADAWCFGEVVDTPESQISYAGYLDGVLDFHLGEGLRHVFAYRSRDMAWLDHFMHDQEGYFPPPDRFSRPIFLDNHDMDRFLHLAAGNAEAMLRLASLFLYSLPHPPILYYGTESGVGQRSGKHIGGAEVAREPMQWDFSAAQQELVSYFQTLAQVRRSEPAMRPTHRDTLLVSADTYLARHQRDDHHLLLVLNRGLAPITIEHPALQGTFRDLLTDESIELKGMIQMGAVHGRLLKEM
jgi:cyclomaltodextrinase